MNAAAGSFRKTAALAAFAFVATASATWAVPRVLEGALAAAVTVLLYGLCAVAAICVLACGLVLYRYRRWSTGAGDLFLAANRRRTEAAVLRAPPTGASPLRRWASSMLNGHRLLVGDRVRILGPGATGRLAPVPWMDEMDRHVGREAVVFRLVDKIYDYNRSSRMRALDGYVLLAGLRCDGDAHGGCQAACYTLWHTTWLQPLLASRSAPTEPAAGSAAAPAQPAPRQAAADVRYVCQFTNLSAASSPLPTVGIARELRPWLGGNVTTAAFVVGLATRLFNLLQSLRGGSGYPPPPAAAKPRPIGEAPRRCDVGTRVRVRSHAEIRATLTPKGKHRGLWFDPDMTKHCGAEHLVQARIEHVIDNVTGRMLTMKTPCIVLDGVYYSGEGQSFSAQHDPLFWREHWLEPLDVPPPRG